MFFTSRWERVGPFAACRHFGGEVGTGRAPTPGGGAGVRGPQGLSWLMVSGDGKGLALPWPGSPAQGDAWQILSEFKSQLVPELKCDLLT